MTYQYQCSQCRRTYEITADLMTCPHCREAQKPEEPLRGILEVKLSLEPGEQWSSLLLPTQDSRKFLPLDKEDFPAIPVGNTPLWEPPRLREELAFPGLFLKDDSLNPTGSLKDRASYMVAAFALSQGIREIVLASTGNAGSSMAGIGAAAGLKVTLFLPEAAPPAKLIQSQLYGAQVIRVKGNYDEACRQAMEYVQSHPGVMSRSTAYNPMTLEGKKTVSLEIFDQLGQEVPEEVFVSVGDGCILGGVYKGFLDLREAGFIDRIPRIWAVQSEGSSAIVRALEQEGRFDKPRQATTLADSISVDVPAAGYYAVEKLMTEKGRGVLVKDEDILRAQSLLASRGGIFAEPAAAAAMAGFLKVREELDPRSRCVILLTGSGLKDIDGARRTLELVLPS